MDELFPPVGLAHPVGLFAGSWPWKGSGEDEGVWRR